MDETYQEKVLKIKKLFSGAADRYAVLIKLGRQLSPFQEDWKTPDRIVKGCQSTMYLYTQFQNGKVYFSAHSEALISAGLAALLISVYSGQTPETILKCPPDFIAELGIGASLSLHRSNGLAQIHLRMKQESIKFLNFC